MARSSHGDTPSQSGFQLPWRSTHLFENQWGGWAHGTVHDSQVLGSLRSQSSLVQHGTALSIPLGGWFLLNRLPEYVGTQVAALHGKFRMGHIVQSEFEGWRGADTASGRPRAIPIGPPHTLRGVLPSWSHPTPEGGLSDTADP